MSEEINETKDPVEPRFPWWMLWVVIGLWVVNLFWGIWAMDNDRTKGGEWGDIFGAVNALFSALAFLMIYYGIQMQRHEVKLAKRELEESKKQTKAQKIALDEQNKATERQMFENTFFRLLDDYNDIVENLACGDFEWVDIDTMWLKYPSSKNSIKGKFIFSHFSHMIYEIFADSTPNGDWVYKEKINFDDRFRVFNNCTKEIMGNYYRTVYNILRFVSQSQIDNKKFYTNIFRAQMSNNEIKVLAFNIASENGREKFLPLAAEFNFLKHCANQFGDIPFLKLFIEKRSFD